MRFVPVLAAACLIAGSAQATECSVTVISALKIPGVTIASADMKSEGPPLCDVKGSLTTTGEGAPDGSARFEVKLPARWNGKFVFLGVGGLGGNLYPSVTRADLLAATTANYATAITDTGHNGASSSDGRWALTRPGVPDEAKLTDYYFRGVHQVTLATRQLVEGYFGKPPARSYFDGCSNGGRQALMEAARYPDDFDGIVAGAPFMDIKAILSGARFYQHLLTPSAYVPAALLAVVDKAMLSACDETDGVKDGLIQNPAKCSLDLKSLICKAGEKDGCLGADQAAALDTYFSATRDTTGSRLFPGAANTDLDGGGMNVWSVGMTAPDDISAAEPWAKLDQRPLSWQFVDNILKYIVERDPDFDLRKFRFDPASVLLFTQHTRDGNADEPSDLKPFIAKGKKLLIYHGYSDPALAPIRTVKFYERLAGIAGGAETVQRNVRLFMAPGMQHCGGGTGPNVFDTLSALDAWVEQGKAPEAITAAHHEGNNPNRPVDRSMPLCPFPTMATYRGQGDAADAENWSCRPNRKMLEHGRAGDEAGFSDTVSVE